MPIDLTSPAETDWMRDHECKVCGDTASETVRMDDEMVWLCLKHYQKHENNAS